MLIEKQLHMMLTAGFRFIVAVNYLPVGAFTECTLPTIEWEVEPLKEGGQNRYIRQLRGPRKQTNVTLQNGIGLMSDIKLWYMRALQEDFSKREVTITILSAMFVPSMVWHIEDAFPVRWSFPQLQTSGTTVAMQTLELACGEITVL